MTSTNFTITQTLYTTYWSNNNEQVLREKNENLKPSHSPSWPLRFQSSLAASRWHPDHGFYLDWARRKGRVFGGCVCECVSNESVFVAKVVRALSFRGRADEAALRVKGNLDERERNEEAKMKGCLKGCLERVLLTGWFWMGKKELCV